MGQVTRQMGLFHASSLSLSHSYLGLRYVLFCLVILHFEEVEQEPASADAWSIGHVESNAEWPEYALDTRSGRECSRRRDTAAGWRPELGPTRRKGSTRVKSEK